MKNCIVSASLSLGLVFGLSVQAAECPTCPPVTIEYKKGVFDGTFAATVKGGPVDYVASFSFEESDGYNNTPNFETPPEGWEYIYGCATYDWDQLAYLDTQYYPTVWNAWGLAGDAMHTAESTLETAYAEAQGDAGSPADTIDDEGTHHFSISTTDVDYKYADGYGYVNRVRTWDATLNPGKSLEIRFDYDYRAGDVQVAYFTSTKTWEITDQGVHIKCVVQAPFTFDDTKSDLTFTWEATVFPSYYRLHFKPDPGQDVTFNWKERERWTDPNDTTTPQFQSPQNGNPMFPSGYDPASDPLYSHGSPAEKNANNGTSGYNESQVGAYGGVDGGGTQKEPVPHSDAVLNADPQMDYGFSWSPAALGSDAFGAHSHLGASAATTDTERSFTATGNGCVMHSPWYRVRGVGINGKFARAEPIIEGSTCTSCAHGHDSPAADSFTIDLGPSVTGGSQGKLIIYPSVLAGVDSGLLCGVDGDCDLAYGDTLYGNGVLLSGYRGVAVPGSPLKALKGAFSVTRDANNNMVITTSRDGTTHQWHVVTSTTGTPTVTITKTVTKGTDVTTETSTYSYEANQRTFTGPGQQTVMRQGDQSDYTETRDGITTRYQYVTLAGDYKVLAQVTKGSNAEQLTTTFSYYDDPETEATFGKLKQVVYPAGGWARRVYNGDGLLSREIVGRGNTPTPTSDSFSLEGCTITEYLYNAQDDEDMLNTHTAFTITDEKPRRITKYFGTGVDTMVPITRTYVVIATNYIRSVSCPEPSAGIGAAENLSTTVWPCTEGATWTLGRPRRIEYPDGRREVHFYNFPNNALVVETVLLGEPDPQNVVNVLKGTRTVIVQRPSGQVLSKTVYDIESGGKVADDWSANFDGEDRPQLKAHLDGSYEILSYSCCGLGTVTRSDGTTTTYEYDGRKRVSVQSDKIGDRTRTTLFNYSGDQVTGTSVGWNNETLTPATLREYDSAGRLTNQVDLVMSITNSFVYSADGLTTTQTLPNGSTEVIARNKDLTVDSIFGTGTAPSSITIALENGQLVSQVFASPDKASGKFWTKTYFDGLLRPVQKVSSAGDPFVFGYNSRGQLVSASDADNVKVVRITDIAGRSEVQTTRTGGADVITDTDLAGNNPVSSNAVFVVTSGDSIANEAVILSRRYVWPSKNENACRVQSELRRSLDGNRAWLTEYKDGTPVTIRSARTQDGDTVTITVTHPKQNYDVELYRGGLLREEASYDSGVCVGKKTYNYDTHSRLWQITDLHDGLTTIEYVSPTKDLIWKITRPLNDVTVFDYDKCGRLKTIVRNGTTIDSRTYNLMGLISLQTGAHFPVGYGYDELGRNTTVTNYGNATSLLNPQVTQWQFDEQTGRLSKMSYPDKVTGMPQANGVSYEYTSAGRLWKVTDLRGIVMTHSYANGVDTGVTPSDSTPPTTFVPNRLGHVEQSTFAGQTTIYSYDTLGNVSSENNTEGLLAGMNVSSSVDAYGLPATLSVTSGGSSIYSRSTSYQSGALLRAVTFGRTAISYEYEPATTLVKTRTGGGVRQTMEYDALRRLKSVTAEVLVPAIETVDSHNYGFDNLSRRQRDTRNDGRFTAYGYNGTGQLISSAQNKAAIEGFEDLDHSTYVGAWTLDGIGNFQTGRNPLNPAQSVSRGFNRQNQVTSQTLPTSLSVRGEVDPRATLAFTPYHATITRYGSNSYSSGPYFRAVMARPTAQTDAFYYVTNKATLPPMANLPSVSATNVTAFYVPVSTSIGYDEAGNTTADGRWIYTWDAYNRLTKVESKPDAPVESMRSVVFTYDAFGRRIGRVISAGDASRVYHQVDSRKYVYSGWKLVAELNGNNNHVIRTYIWANNVLLAIIQDGATYIPTFDGNGNVMTLVDKNTGTVAARYEYSPFGMLLKASGPMAMENPIRFSSEYQDDVTGLIYYGLRYFNPATQTWLSRDPIGMLGGFNLYAMVNNDPVNNRDLLGLIDQDPIRPTPDTVPGFLLGLGQVIANWGLGIAQTRLMEEDNAAFDRALEAVAEAQRQLEEEVVPPRVAKLDSGGQTAYLATEPAAAVAATAVALKGTLCTMRSYEGAPVTSQVPKASGLTGAGKAGSGAGKVTATSADCAEAAAAEGTAMRNVAQFEGIEVRGMRDLSHLSEGKLEAMQEFGIAGSTENGERIVLHHLNQNPAGPVVEMPEIFHTTANRVQHPFGNTPDAGLTAEQRAAFDAWRENYWSWRATQELNRRRLGL